MKNYNDGHENTENISSRSQKEMGGEEVGAVKVSPRLTSRTHFEYIAQFRWVEFYRHRKQFEKH